MNLIKRTTALLAVTLALGTAGCNKADSDAAITSRVKTAISNEPALKATRVSVSTDEKVVHLSGTVKSRDERALLIAAARKVDGVKAVRTDLTVKAEQKPRVEARAKPQAEARAKKPQSRAQQQVKSHPPEQPPRYGN
jgi:hyperosmotically inducible protein